jgi:ribonucleoside-diphosphate reductase alpha chain
MVISDLIRATRVTFGDNSRTALKRRHLLRDASGAVVETPEEMLARVAEAIASVEPEAATRRPLARRFYDDVRADVPRLRDAARVRGALSVV